jgi:phage I-like protein
MSDRPTGRVLSEAERCEARYNLLTTGQVAARLSDENIDGDTVRSWIDDGRLRAVDGRRKGARSPYWLISWDWVEEFVANGGRSRAAA